MTLKSYRSHKLVMAALIVAVSDRKLVLKGEEEGPHYELVNAETFFEKRVPEGLAGKAPGGYLVVYGDGYESWSPKEAFEDGYHPVDMESYETLFSTLPIDAILKELAFRVQNEPELQQLVASIVPNEALWDTLQARGLPVARPTQGAVGEAVAVATGIKAVAAHIAGRATEATADGAAGDGGTGETASDGEHMATTETVAGQSHPAAEQAGAGGVGEEFAPKPEHEGDAFTVTDADVGTVDTVLTEADTAQPIAAEQQQGDAAQSQA